MATKAAFTDALLQKYMYQSERGCSAVDKAGNRADKTNNNGNFKRVFLKLSWDKTKTEENRNCLDFYQNFYGAENT